jgi:hypothetical protein
MFSWGVIAVIGVIAGIEIAAFAPSTAIFTDWDQWPDGDIT